MLFEIAGSSPSVAIAGNLKASSDRDRIVSPIFLKLNSTTEHLFTKKGREQKAFPERLGDEGEFLL
ncbi:hypothetical protein [Scytonema sp. NUACC26]|uniref:hypothetical protein n=1 Tax=Scytonema sp. NUACC26 TaxID=3140176 RepID=UPI0038B36900